MAAAKPVLGPESVALISVDTEGNSRNGLREIAAVVIDDPDMFFFDTVTPVSASEMKLAPSDAIRTWTRIGPKFWEWVGERADKIVLVGHNIRAHDAPLLVKETARACQSDFVKIAHRVFICDTLAATRAMIPFEELRYRTQASVYTFLFGGKPLKMHTAMHDARSNAAIAKHERIAAFVNDEKNWTPLSGTKSKRASRAARSATVTSSAAKPPIVGSDI